MIGDRSRLRNFMKKFIGMVRFGNDHFGAIMGYGDYVIGESVISRIYYVEGLGHNLFSVGQFCDSDLEVAFRMHSCYVRDTYSVELIKGSRGSNLYTISIEYMLKSSPICLLSKAFKNKSWLWHRCLNHLNFGTINDLARKDLVRGLHRLKFEKDHLCFACQLGKSKKHTHKPKTENTNLEVLNTLHIDLCGPMRVQTINRKRYILVIVNDYWRFTWVKFLRSKDETLEVVIKFLKQIQVGLNKTVKNTMADVNVNAPAEQAPAMAPPTRTDDQILPRIRWVPIGKSNCYLDVERSQSNPIYKIAVDILKHTNFFRAFTASSTIPSIYIQQFWDTRALTTVINLCLMGKTSGFERPRALVLQILWGIINRAHINYAKRMWEEFTQSIHTFIEDKKNLAHHTQGKKKATLIVIPSVRFTKLIIYYLQSKHKFHPRPGSPLHLPNKEPIIRYLKFSAKGTKREVFGMPIPNDLITDDIRAKRSKAGKVVKKRTKNSSLQLVDEFVDEGVPENEPRIGDEEAGLQKAVEESLKEVYSARQGPLPPVVIREPESGEFQPLPEVQGKGKEKFIFQRRTSTPTESSGNDESSSLYVELGLTDNEMDSDEEVPGMVARVQAKGQAGPNPGEHDEG
ncbi:retrovirus-related pol polyprotein from transposon TNT 1-94 [Tanacetum coccineum]